MTAGAETAGTLSVLARMKPLRIGGYEIDPPFLLAPMAGVSEAPYRTLVQRLGAGLAPTELISSKGLHYRNSRTEAYLKHDPAAEPLLAVQLYGGEPRAMADAAEVAVQRGARMLDVNMGCPVKKITRNQAGSALMRAPERAAAVVQAMVERVGPRVPVTVKIRAGWDRDHVNAPELGARLRDAGAAAIALHPRTREQGYSGHADWSLIRRLKEAIPELPIIANGDVDGVASAVAVVERTGCDAVMVGRAALGNPWVFQSLAAAREGREDPGPPAPDVRSQVVLGHLAASIEHLEDEMRALKKFRQHLVWYSRGLKGNVRFRERVLTLERRADVEAEIAAFFTHALPAWDEVAEYDERRAYG